MTTDNLGFVQLMQNFRRGTLISAADAKLAELLEAIAETGKGGTLTVTIPLKMNKGGQIECDPKVDIKKPVRDIGTGIYYLDGENRLTRRDPNQMDIEDELAPRRSAAE